MSSTGSSWSAEGRRLQLKRSCPRALGNRETVGVLRVDAASAMACEESDIREPSRTLWARGGKRAFDLVAASVLLILLSPLLLFVGLIIRLTSRGAVFFRQERGGLCGASFRTYKFRTMSADRRPDPKELVPLHHADITPFGRFLRRTKLDELPQLINVIRGDMSLVGPRPTLPDQIAVYDDFRRQRLLMRPGITGLAQVYSSAMDSWEERILYDIAYVRRCSFVLDARILLRTVLTVVLGEHRTRRTFSETKFANVVSPPPGFYNPDRLPGADPP